MKIKDLREILIHYEGKEYDDWELVLWDYNNQRRITWPSGSYASTKEAKQIVFPVNVPPVDGKTIDERIEALYNSINKKENGTEENNSN